MVKRAVVWCQDQHLALTNAHVAVSGRLFRPFHVRARSTAKLPVTTFGSYTPSLVYLPEVYWSVAAHDLRIGWCGGKSRPRPNCLVSACRFRVVKLPGRGSYTDQIFLVI